MRSVAEIYESNDTKKILKDLKTVVVSNSFVEYLGYGGILYSLPDFLELKENFNKEMNNEN